MFKEPKSLEELKAWISLLNNAGGCKTCTSGPFMSSSGPPTQ